MTNMSREMFPTVMEPAERLTDRWYARSSPKLDSYTAKGIKSTRGNFLMHATLTGSEENLKELESRKQEDLG